MTIVGSSTRIIAGLVLDVNLNIDVSTAMAVDMACIIVLGKTKGVKVDYWNLGLQKIQSKLVMLVT